jgi:hypothetical protein
MTLKETKTATELAAIIMREVGQLLECGDIVLGQAPLEPKRMGRSALWTSAARYWN